MFAIRDGKWKLVAGNGSGGREKPLGEPFGRPYRLYDLSEDIREQHDLLTKAPDTAKRLEGELQRLIDAGRSR
jgi:hypothetical protein